MPLAHLFDIGNVILTFDFPIGVGRVAPLCSLSPESISTAVDALKDGLESGAMGTDDFIREATRRIGFRGSAEDFRTAFQDIFTPNEPMVGLITELAEAGAPLYLLSNTNGIHVPWFTSEYRVFDLFSGAVYSHEAGVMKPDRRIFEIAIRKFDLVPGETVYIDDLAANVDAAAALGFRAIRYEHGDHAGFLERWRSVSG